MGNLPYGKTRNKRQLVCLFNNRSELVNQVNREEDTLKD